MQPRLRFAPSPTGNLHIGSVRTAIFNWVWAKKLGAALVLRIEDTDLERSTQAFEQNIFEGLDWLGIHFDESPMQPAGSMLYRQSERIHANVYNKYLKTLIDNGDAYYCFETDEELELERQAAEEKGEAYMYSRRSLQYTPEEVAEKLASGIPWTIRFKVPDDQTLVMKDVIRGDISFEANLISDFIIVKSDGNPTYNFAVVIDDYEMGITHVVRGEDHISNTPKQMMIFQALGWEVPIFAHLPIILGSDRSKLSKRHGAKSVSEYRDEGFLPHALINYLSLLGWSPPEGKELLSLDELNDLFNVERINKAGAVFDTVKLTWMNKQYLSQLSDAEFLNVAMSYLSDESKALVDRDKKILSIRDNVDVLSNTDVYLEVYRLSTEGYFEKYKELSMADSDFAVLRFAQAEITKTDEWSPSFVDELIGRIMKELSLGRGKVMKPLRKGLTGYESGPNLADCLALIPQQEILNRLEKVLNYVNS
ncbi:MAG: glutamate--tRNA ligase [Candidatus Marinamargulisbacteria bacterium]